MRISVVIVTRNRSSLLDATLDGLRRQDFRPDDEVVVVDNGSTDATPDVIARAARGFPARFTTFRETTPGKTPALNRGIARTTGEILALTDDDVIVGEDWIATIRRIFLEGPLDLAGGRVDPRWEAAPPRWLHIEDHGRYGPMTSPLALLHYGEAGELGERTALGANLTVRRSVFDHLGGFAPHLGRSPGTLLCGEDHDFCQRAAAAGYRCEYRPELRARHWVPAERTRLTYYLRWFFWSGVTNARLDRRPGTGGLDTAERVTSAYFVRRLLLAPARVLASALAGRPGDAVRAAMDGAFVLGVLSERIRYRVRGENVPRAAHEQASALVR